MFDGEDGRHYLIEKTLVNFLLVKHEMDDDLSKKAISDFLKAYEKLSNINKESLEKIINDLISNYKTNFKSIGQPLRIALVGSKFGPGIYDIILSLDKNEVSKRLKTII